MRNGYREIYAPWREAVSLRRTVGISAVAQENSVLIHVRAEFRNLASYDLHYLVEPTGSVTIEASFRPFFRIDAAIAKTRADRGIGRRFPARDLVRARATRNSLGSKNRGKLGRYELAVDCAASSLCVPPAKRQPNRCALDTANEFQGFGIRFTADTVLQFVAHDYTDEDIENAAHDHEITHRDFIEVQLDHQQMGIGGDNAWGAEVHEEYWVKANPYRYTRPPRFDWLTIKYRGEPNVAIQDNLAEVTRPETDVELPWTWRSI